MISIEYAAGFFDGEGCITGSRGYNDRNAWLALSVASTNRGVLEEFERAFGGGILRAGKGNDRHKPSFVWRPGREEMYQFLYKALPFLIVKKPVVDVVLEYEQYFRPIYLLLPSATPLPDEFREKRLEALARIRILNHRGPS